MIPSATNIVIIGGGIIGLSIAHALARQGEKDILLLEKDAVGSGASGKSGALIRMHYTNRWDATLAKSSYQTFQDWSEVIGGPPVFHRTGFLMVVTEENVGRLNANVEMLRDLGVDTRVIDAQEMAELEPNAVTHDVGAAAYEPGGGYVDGSIALQSLLTSLRARGATIAEGVGADSITVRNGKISGVRTSAGDILSNHVVVAGGAWSSSLLFQLGISSHVRSKRILNHFVGWPEDFQGSHMVYLDNVVGTYFRPDAGRFSIVGAHSMEWDINPDFLGTEVPEKSMNQARERLARRLPKLKSGRPSGGRSAFDSYSEDMHAIIDSSFGPDGLHIATGFSGAGFKIAPAVGEAIAESILLGDSKTHDVSAFRLSRFDEGQPIQGQHEYPVMAGTGTRLA